MARFAQTVSSKRQRMKRVGVETEVVCSLHKNSDPALAVRWNKRGCRIRRTRVRTTHNAERQCRITHRAGNHAFGDQAAINIGMLGALRNKAARRLQPNKAAAGGRNADGARAVRGMSQRHHA